MKSKKLQLPRGRNKCKSSPQEESSSSIMKLKSPHAGRSMEDGGEIELRRGRSKSKSPHAGRSREDEGENELRRGRNKSKSPHGSMRGRSKSKSPTADLKMDKGKEKFSKIPKKNAPSTKDSRSLPTFRSSFVSLYLLVGSLRKHITDDHMKIMEKTPFAGIFRVFIEDKVDKSNVTKASSDIVTVLDRYDVDRDAFTFGKTSVPFTVQDVAVVFGLPAIGKTVILQPRGYIVKSEFMERNFKGDEKLSKLNLEKALKKTVLNACETDMEDFAKLMVVYIVMNVFAPWIAFSFFQYVEDFYEMNEIAWAEVFFTNLKKQVVKWKTANSITYCPMMLLYFLLEHVDLIAPIKGNEDVSPRFGKWCLTTLKDTLSAEKLEKISAEKVLTQSQ